METSTVWRGVLDCDMELFHATTNPLVQFLARAPTPALNDGEVVYGEARPLGTFFSTSPRIAAHFVLKPEVIDAGYDSDEGSASLCRNPWFFDDQPFSPSAQVLQCQAPDQLRWQELSALEWVEMVSTQEEEFFQTLREDALAAGFDGIRIQAWDGQEEHPEFGRPCVEYYADTYVAFDPTLVSIVDARPAEEAWDMAPEPVPGNANALLPSPPKVPRPRFR